MTTCPGAPGKIEVVGRGGIKARVIADSINFYTTTRLITLELEYHKFMHPEFLTHRDFSRNSASSRAIPVMTVLNNIESNMAMPIHWGKNKRGMQADEETDAPVIIDGREYSPQEAWKLAFRRMRPIIEAMAEAGYHKQVTNRLGEPFQMIKTVVSATEWQNFFDLRRHPDAQPEIRELANVMHEAIATSRLTKVHTGWHLPYITDEIWESECGKNIEVAKRISAACCAQVSYRKNDPTAQKALGIYDRLAAANPPHLSPFEHVALAMPENKRYANFRSWRQFRWDIENQ